MNGPRWWWFNELELYAELSLELTFWFMLQEFISGSRLAILFVSYTATSELAFPDEFSEQSSSPCCLLELVACVLLELPPLGLQLADLLIPIRRLKWRFKPANLRRLRPPGTIVVCTKAIASPVSANNKTRRSILNPRGRSEYSWNIEYKKFDFKLPRLICSNKREASSCEGSKSSFRLQWFSWLQHFLITLELSETVSLQINEWNSELPLSKQLNLFSSSWGSSCW